MISHNIVNNKANFDSTYYKTVNTDLIQTKEQLLFTQWKTQGLKKMNNGCPYVLDYSGASIDAFSLNSSCIEPIMENLKSEYPWILEKKIKNIIVATHSVDIHSKLEKIFNEFGFKIIENRPYGTVGGDGMLIINK